MLIYLFQTTPAFVNLTTNLGGLSATIGEPFKVLVDISIPAPATVGVATPYVLEVLSPFSTTGIFKLCSFEIVSVGRDLPCLNKDKVVTRYGTQATDGSNLPDRATMDLGEIPCVLKFQGNDALGIFSARFYKEEDFPPDLSR